ncbi:MAG: substrate-binding domain-containing protein [Gammaproteobacteria bacterium]|nr:substrate-binding domain-containing protein [Gammaproteobacteria bacterium]
MGAAVLTLVLLSAALMPQPCAGFDLRSLPHYQAVRQLTGTLRIFGSDLNGMLPIWERGFRAHQPALQFDNRYVSSDAGIAGLVSGAADLAPQAREPTWLEQQWFAAAFGHPPEAVTVAGGAYDKEGMADGLVIFVHRDNPLAGLTLPQLAGIFGAARTGAFDRAAWNVSLAVAPGAEIRRWGQLGLEGDWADKPIQTYGYAPSGMSNFFQLQVLAGSDKWNSNYREYVESGTKMLATDDAAMRGGLHSMLATELSRDRYGIAIGVLPQAHGLAGIRALPLSRSNDAPFVAPSPQSFQDRRYPLSRSIYIYLNRAPGAPLDPKLKEFLLYVLSQEGQAAVEAAGNYLPLNAATVREQRRRLGLQALRP